MNKNSVQQEKNSSGERAESPSPAPERLQDIRRWSRLTAEMEDVAAKNGIRPMESKNERRLRSDIDYLLSRLPERETESDQGTT